MLLLPRSWLDANESCIQTRSFGKGEIFNTAWFLIVSFANTCHCIISYCFIWEAISKTRASCFIRGSKHLETIKARGSVWNPWWNARTRFWYITWMGSLVDSFWDRGKSQLVNGQFDHMMNSYYCLLLTGGSRCECDNYLVRVSRDFWKVFVS